MANIEPSQLLQTPMISGQGDTPSASVPVAPAPGPAQAPAPAPTPTSATPTPTPTGVTTPASTPPNSTGMSDTSFLGVMNNINNSLQQNNNLVTQKNLIQKQLFDQPLTPAELKSLPPDVAQVLQSGNQQQMKLQLQVINDALQGRNQSAAASIQFLTTGYETSQANALKASQFIMTTAENTGNTPESIAKAYANTLGLSGGDVTNLIKNLKGFALKSLKSTLTQAISSGEFGLTVPSGTIASQTNNPLNIKFSDTSSGANSGIPGQDGGTFASYSSPSEGLQAGIDKLTSSQYSNLTVDAAMKLWSNNGYGAEVSPGTNADQTVSSLSDTQLQQLVSDMAKRESGSTTYNTKDVSQVVSKIPASQMDTGQTSFGGLSLNGLVEASTLWLNDLGKIPSLGLGAAADVKTARTSIINYSGYLANKMGTDVSKLSMLYKAKTTAVSQNIQRLSKVDSITNSVSNQLPRLATLADQLKAEGISITESDIQSFAASGLNKFGSNTAAAYMELVNTVRADYSASNAALAGSRGGEFFAHSALDAIPTGLTGAQYNTIKDTIILSTKNVSDGINKTTSDMINSLGTNESGIGGSSNPSTSVTIGGQSYKPKDTITNGSLTLTVSDDGKSLSGSDGNTYDLNGNIVTK